MRAVVVWHEGGVEAIAVFNSDQEAIDFTNRLADNNPMDYKIHDGPVELEDAIADFVATST